MDIIEIISYIFMVLGLFFMGMGILGLFKFTNFYARLLITSKIDTMGTFLFIIGLAIRHGFSFFTAKLILLIVIIMMLNPLMAHFLAKSAYQAGLDENNKYTRNRK